MQGESPRSDGAARRERQPAGVDRATLDQVTFGHTVEQWVHTDPRLTYWVSRLIAGRALKLFYRLRSYGVYNVPRSGPLLLCPNHSSWIDGFLHAAALPRIMRWMGKKEVFEWPIVRWYVRHGGTFPVDRGKSDQVAMDIARLALLDGQGVSIYPEGTRHKHSQGLGPPKSGMARLALATGAPVCPMASFGVKSATGRGDRPSRIPRLPRVTTVIGEPLVYPVEPDPSRERVEQVRDEIWAEVTRLYAIAGEISAQRKRPDPRTYRVPPRSGATHA